MGTLTITNDLSALATGSQPASKIDTNFNDVATFINGGNLDATNVPTLSAKEPALGNPASSGQVLTSTIAGVRSWTDRPGGFVNRQVFDSSGTWTMPAGISKIFAEVWGGGGGGGNGASGTGSGSGGGGGGYASGILTVSGNVTVTVGAAGAAVGAGGQSSISGGGLAASLTCNGGGAGVTGGGAGGAGGTTGASWSGHETITGQDGERNVSGSGAGGNCGKGGPGGPAIPGTSTLSGPAGRAPGGGGAGGARDNSTAGGVGGKGRVVIWY